MDKRSFELPWGGRCTYAAWGSEDGLPVVLLHAQGCHAGWWAWAGPLIAEMGYLCIAPDFRGHGDSSSAAQYSFLAYAQDISQLTAGLGLESPHLIGHSMGGYVGLILSASRPDQVGSLIMADMKTSVEPDELEMSAQAATRPGKVFPDLASAVSGYRLMPPEHRVPPERLRLVAEQSFRPAEGGGVVGKFDRRALALEPLKPKELASDLKCRALVVRGGLSTVMEAEPARRLAEMAPQGSFEEMPGCYHHLILEEPETFARLVGEFIRGS